MLLRWLRFLFVVLPPAAVLAADLAVISDARLDSHRDSSTVEPG